MGQTAGGSQGQGFSRLSAIPVRMPTIALVNFAGSFRLSSLAVGHLAQLGLRIGELPLVSLSETGEASLSVLRGLNFYAKLNLGASGSGLGGMDSMVKGGTPELDLYASLTSDLMMFGATLPNRLKVARDLEFGNGFLNISNHAPQVSFGP